MTGVVLETARHLLTLCSEIGDLISDVLKQCLFRAARLLRFSLWSTSRSILMTGCKSVRYRLLCLTSEINMPSTCARCRSSLPSL
jgi:hypothetical protein